jgi:hypothetical protein
MRFELDAKLRGEANSEIAGYLNRLWIYLVILHCDGVHGFFGCFSHVITCRKKTEKGKEEKLRQ